MKTDWWYFQVDPLTWESTLEVTIDFSSCQNHHHYHHHHHHHHRHHYHHHIDHDCLQIGLVQTKDFGSYVCIASNQWGETKHQVIIVMIAIMILIFTILMTTMMIVVIQLSLPS